MRNVNAVRTVQTQYTTSSATYLRACHHATHKRHKSTALFDDSSVTKFVSQTGTCIIYISSKAAARFFSYVELGLGI